MYTDAACANLAPGRELPCDKHPVGGMVACCQNACLADFGKGCDAINVSPKLGRCVLRRCNGTAAPDQPDQDWDAYHMALPGGPLAAGYAVDLTAAGFAFNTKVSIRSLFDGKELGVFAGAFETPAPIALHGTLLLRLTYKPQYPPHREL